MFEPQRDGELAWANEAIFKVDTGTLTLKESPFYNGARA